MADGLEQTLRKIRRQHVREEDNPAVQGYKCSKCHDTGFLLREENGSLIARRCECYYVRQAETLMEKSGISEEFGKKSFGNFETLSNPQLIAAKSKAARYVEDFLQTEHSRHNSIMFCGQVGSGKTHLGTAICGELMKKGIAVIYMAYRNAITKIKQSITDEDSYNRQLSRYMSARVLYIDDFLKGRITEADVNIVYEIVNYRYMNNLPIVLSTEKTLGSLLDFDEAAGSRLIEMCRGNVVQLEGRELNYRMR